MEITSKGNFQNILFSGRKFYSIRVLPDRRQILSGTSLKVAIQTAACGQLCNTYPYPVPCLPGFVITFLPGALYSLPGRPTGLKAPIGPLKVP